MAEAEEADEEADGFFHGVCAVNCVSIYLIKCKRAFGETMANGKTRITMKKPQKRLY